MISNRVSASVDISDAILGPVTVSFVQKAVILGWSFLGPDEQADSCASHTFKGVIDEVAIYNSALSEEAVFHHYLASQGGGMRGLPCVERTPFPQAPCDSLWCCQWYDGCWADVDE